ncbi:MAG TPA: valine--tRNA ligase [Steroidobacteraceae bacterium]|nr:valine--tRNA ligase [Steroidobacteraceae bacterium]
MTDISTMEKTYDPQAIEQRWYREWEQRGYFAPRAEGNPYCIMIPPPNVTGTLHMGHAFQDTIMDALTRQHRMRGDATLWQVGTDHAGIATQMVVERQLNAAGQTRADLGREAFVKRVWEWKAQSGGTIVQQLRRLGASVDWSRERFTMDEQLSRAVTEVFVRLFDEGLIYRGKRLVNWDPVLLTALSDLEVLSQEEEGHLWHLRYPLADGTGHLVVATTRPETMLGDTAVAVHPEDERYRHLIGKQVRLPIAERLIPVIADDFVDREFGSGVVKITPAHDFTDNEVGVRHQLPQLNIFTPTAHLNENAPARLQGLSREKAREQVVAELQGAGLIERIDKHKLMVPRGDRSGVILEPLLTDQWYVRIEPLAKPAIEAVESGRVRFVPENWSKTYFEWMRNIRDWCISRQLWWGHQIPAWYDDAGNVYVARSESEAKAQARAKHGSDVQLQRDADVLDTWFSSALWPFSTLGWPDTNVDLKRFYPGNVLVTGFDIIFFWVARMMMFGIKFMGDVPFREVYIHGLVRDGEGQKMSKSKGNVLDPLDIVDGISLDALLKKRTTGLMQPHLAPGIEKATRKQFPNGIEAHGTDALRFTFAALATQSRDIRFELGRVAGYRNFCNKLWNAARFVLLMTEGKLVAPKGTVSASVVDRWIVSRLGAAITATDQAFAEYRFDMAATALYEFTWHEFCDWYLELSKPVVQGDDETAAAATRRTLLTVLEALLRALHPLMPFITEEIWQRVAVAAGVQGNTIMQAAWPQAKDWADDTAATADVAWMKGVILGLRQIRGEMDISPARRLAPLVQGASGEDVQRFTRYDALLGRLAGIDSIRVLQPGEAAPASASAVVGNLTVLVPMQGLIDPAAELVRLKRKQEKTQQEITRAQAKLANPNFVNHAPPEVVTTERERIAQFQSASETLARQIVIVAGLIQN